MNTATTTAAERSFTSQEGLEAMRLAWAAVEEFGISLYPPYRGGGGQFLACWKGDKGYEWGGGAGPIEAVEELLRKIGGVE